MIWPFKQRPNPTAEAVMLELKLIGRLKNRIDALEAREAEHALAIDKLGERLGIEYNAGEWCAKPYLLTEAEVSAEPERATHTGGPVRVEWE
jgi:hypothetical protein